MPITNPHLIQAETYNPETGRANVHLEDGEAVVYSPLSQDAGVNGNILILATLAYAFGLTVSIKWDDETEVPGETERQRRIIRISLERKAQPATEGIIPWSEPREG